MEQLTPWIDAIYISLVCSGVISHFLLYNMSDLRWSVEPELACWSMCVICWVVSGLHIFALYWMVPDLTALDVAPSYLGMIVCTWGIIHTTIKYVTGRDWQ